MDGEEFEVPATASNDAVELPATGCEDEVPIAADPDGNEVPTNNITFFSGFILVCLFLFFLNRTVLTIFLTWH